MQLNDKHIEKLRAELTKRTKQTTSNDDTRAALFDIYMAEPYPGDPIPSKTGKGGTQSTFMSTAAGDLVSTIHAEAMDLLTSSGNLASFVPVGPDDEDAAQQETDVVNHIIFEQNNGWLTLHNWVLSAFIEQVGYVRSGWEEKEEVRIDDFKGKTFDELAMMAMEYEHAGEDYEFVETEEAEDGTIDVTVRCVKKDNRYVISTFPQSEFVVAHDWPNITLSGVPFCGWLRDDWTMADLIDFGFDKDSLDQLDEAEDDIGDTGRKNTRDHSEDGDGKDERYAVGEYYIRMAFEKGQPASMWQVWASGDGKCILKWKDGTDCVKEVDGHPFTAITPFIIPHRHAGRSVVELAKANQAVETVTWRRMLDNINNTAYARPVTGPLADQQLFDDLMNPAPGAIIRSQGLDDFRWDVPPDITGPALHILEMMKSDLEGKTGATRYNQGLDADSLNKTASGIRQIMSASQKRLLAIVRTIKETGIKELYQNVHRDLRRGPAKAMTMRLRGQWVDVDSTAWRKREDVTVSATNDKDMKTQALQMMAAMQEKVLMSGMPRATEMITPQEIYHTIEQTMLGMGMKSIAGFIKDPASLPPPQPAPEAPPDPAMIAAETQRMAAETGRMAAQAKAEIDIEAMDIKRQEVMLKLREMDMREADQVGKFENEAERNDIQRDAAAAQDDRQREVAAMTFATAISAQDQAAIAAAHPNPVIDGGGNGS